MSRISFFILVSFLSLGARAQSNDPLPTEHQPTALQPIEAAQIESLSFKQKHIEPVLYRLTDRTSALTFLAGTAAVAAAHPQDDSIRDQWKDHQHMDKNSAHVGDLMGTGALAVLGAGAEYLLDDRSYIYQSHLRGLIYGGIGIYALKTTFGRPRPGGSENRQSFPSGHTAITFMTATHFTYAYGWKAAVIAYPVAAFVGASRLADDAHWFSDTVGGAFLGFMIGRASFYDENEFYKQTSSAQTTEKGSAQGIDWQAYPILSSRETGAALFVSF